MCLIAKTPKAPQPVIPPSPPPPPTLAIPGSAAVDNQSSPARAKTSTKGRGLSPLTNSLSIPGSSAGTGLQIPR